MTQMTSKLSLSLNKKYAALAIAEMVLSGYWDHGVKPLVELNSDIEGLHLRRVVNAIWYWREKSLKKHKLGAFSDVERDLMAAKLIREKMRRMARQWGDTIDSKRWVQSQNLQE
jgi:hypothetical protein